MLILSPPLFFTSFYRCTYQKNTCVVKGNFMKKTFRVFLILIIVILIASAACYVLRPYDSKVTVEGLQNATASTTILVQMTDTQVSGEDAYAYYEIEGSAALSDLFQFERWTVSNTVSSSDPLLLLRFEESWLLALYADGSALAHNGYAAIGYKSDCCYKVSTQALYQICSYIETYGTVHKYGDGTIGAGTFHR